MKGTAQTRYNKLKIKRDKLDKEMMEMLIVDAKQDSTNFFKRITVFEELNKCLLRQICDLEIKRATICAQFYRDEISAENMRLRISEIDITLTQFRQNTLDNALQQLKDAKLLDKK